MRLSSRHSKHHQRVKPALMALVLVLISSGPALGSPRSGTPTLAMDASVTAGRAVTMRDAIEMTRLGDPLYLAGLSSKGLVARFSPDGKQFVMVLRRGKLDENTNEYTLLLYRSEEVFRQPPRRVLVSLATSSNSPAIQDPVWLSDNDTILFLGHSHSDATQLYSVRSSTGQLTRLTDHVTDLLSFSSTAQGDRIAYTAEGVPRKRDRVTVEHHGIRIAPEQSLSETVRDPWTEEASEDELWLKDLVSGEEVQVRTRGRIDGSRANPVFSPDGEHLIIQSELREIPSTWREYKSQFIQMLTSHKPAPAANTRLFRYELVDPRTGDSEVLLDAPTNPIGLPEIAWSPDSGSVVVSNVYLPLNVPDPSERLARASHTFLVELQMESRMIEKISDRDVRLIRWDPESRDLICELGMIDSLIGKTVPTVYFHKDRGRWAETKIPPATARTHPEIVLEEDEDSPPQIFAVDSTTRKKSLLLDLNPQLHNLLFGKVEEITWTDSLGDEVKGGLYWPVDYVRGRKYPLVIQTHGYRWNRFWIDGPFTTAFAAQPLSGKGFFVLQLPDPEDRFWDTTEEAPRAMAAYEGAVAYLDRKGLIDTSRVGIIGFSRTCFYLTYTLTHSKIRFRAASISDGADGSYFQYMIIANSRPTHANEYDLLNGTQPFGEGLRAWFERSPAFLMDRVETPLLILAIRPASLLSEWHWFSGLTRLERPVDLIYIPDGVHVLERPWDRMISEQGDVDWFCFWLKGEEDPDPDKAEQYRAWRALPAIRRTEEDAP